MYFILLIFYRKFKEISRKDEELLKKNELILEA